MARFDLICRDCSHRFVVVIRVAIRDKQKRCPVCESHNVRQTLAGYLRNGALSDALCGAPQRSSGYG